jgi:hypothetical protein
MKTSPYLFNNILTSGKITTFAKIPTKFPHAKNFNPHYNHLSDGK